MNKKKPRRSGFVPERAPLTAEAAEALEVVEAIGETISERIEPRTVSSHASFFESIQERAESIGETIQNRNAATENQMKALKNMLEAVKKWIH